MRMVAFVNEDGIVCFGVDIWVDDWSEENASEVRADGGGLGCVEGDVCEEVRNGKGGARGVEELGRFCEVMVVSAVIEQPDQMHT